MTFDDAHNEMTFFHEFRTLKTTLLEILTLVDMI